MSVVSRLREAGFEVYTRKEWGSPREADGSYAERAGTLSYRVPKPAPYHYLHLTVSRDSNSVQEGFAGARQVEGYGYSTPPMVSYHMLVTNEGKAFEGQSYGVKGTHTVNDKKVPGFPRDLNLYGYAVALMQDVEDVVTDDQVELVAACFAAAELEGWVERGAPIYPHRMFAAKGCPGDRAMARLDDIVRLKNKFVQEGLQMPLSTEDLQKIRDIVSRAPITTKVIPGEENEKQALEWVMRRLLNDNAEIRARLEVAVAEARKDVYNGPSAVDIAAAVKSVIPAASNVSLVDIEKAVATVLKKGTLNYT